jgi:predicted RNA-binding Zn ribbon-like protein
MPETPALPPTAATTRFDGGHPAIELVNTIYGQVGGPVEHDMLTTPEDLVILARRLGLAGDDTPASPAALSAAHELRETVDALLRARVEDAPPPPGALAALEHSARDGLEAATLTPHGATIAWVWPTSDAHTPVHRFAYAAIELLSDETELSRLHQCAGCCWLFLDHSRGAGRRWCSMEWCGSEAKKRRYVQRRRERRRRAETN